MEPVLNEVLKSLRSQLASGARHIFLALPHWLYMTDQQASLFETATVRNPAYQQKIDLPIRKLLKDNAPEFFASIKSSANFIDLGPGYPSKSLDLIDYLRSHHIKLTYYPVDISKFFLDRAVAAVSARGIPCHPLNRKFEELGPILDASLAPRIPRIVFIGLTFNNFELSHIIHILREITRRSDLCLICNQLPGKKSPAELVLPYQGESVQSFAFEPLKLLGFRLDSVQYEPRFYDDAIQADFLTSREIKIDGIRIPKSTTITVGRSYRYDLVSLETTLNEIFYIRHEYIDQASSLSLLVLGGK